MSSKIIGKINLDKQTKGHDRPLKQSLGELIKCVFCPKCKMRVPMEFVDDNGVCRPCRTT